MELLTEKEAARIIKVHPGTLSNNRVKRVVLPFVKMGKLIRYRKSDIEKFLYENIVTITNNWKK